MYIPKDWQGKIGVMGDLHVSSRQNLYKQQGVKAQVIPGADQEKISPLIGPMAHENLSSSGHLLSEMKDSDVVALVGDIYDHTINCDPWKFVVNQNEVLTGMDTGKEVKLDSSITNTAGLWEAMSYEKYKGKDYDAYPREIDGLMMLSRVLDFYTKRQKPVIYISGNHEGYERPFGVSPRVRLSDAIPLMHADSGIPADHNLTAYEACLLHGKASYDLGTGLPWKLNFNKENFEWLYCLYTPWKDFVFSYAAKSEEQSTGGKPSPDPVYNLIALGWGNDETIVDSFFSGGGTLPRTEVACTKDQLAITKWATDKSGANYNILLSHFTFVGYDLDKPFSDGKAQVIISDNSKTHYDIGSFYKNRPAMYGLLKDSIFYLQDGKSMPRPGKIHYTISGHAHRAGAYAFASTSDKSTKLETTAWLYSDPGKPLALDLHALSPWKSIASARCLVCGSAGPYSHRNLNGELGGQGLARPQGLILDVPNDRVEWREWKKATTDDLPRLAVIIDYLWYIGDYQPFDDGPDFDIWWKGIHRYGNDFYFILGKKFKALFSESRHHPFASIQLIAMGKKGSASLRFSPEPQETANTKYLLEELDTGGTHEGGPQEKKFKPPPMVVRMSLDPDGFQDFKEELEEKGDILGHFLSITFTEVPGVVKADEYDLKSPWCFPVKIDGDEYKSIVRWSANENGEVPDWDDFYAKKWKDEYKNNPDQQQEDSI